MIDICLFGREISISSAPSGRACVLFYFRQSHAGIIICPAVVVGDDAAWDLHRDDYIVRFVRYKRFVRLSCW